MSEEIHHILLGLGFKYIHANRLPRDELIYSKSMKIGCYSKDYSTHQGMFSIALILRDDIYLQLPIAYVLRFPEVYRGRLIPHISNEKLLCYVDQKEGDWDPNNLPNLYKDIDLQIQKTLDAAVNSIVQGDPSDVELEGEFAQYWDAEEKLFLLEKPCRKTNLTTWCLEKKLKDSESYVEFVTISAKNEENDLLARWMLHRHFDSESFKEVSLSTHLVSVKPNKLAGIAWPPRSLGDTLRWLTNVDHNARNQLINQMVVSGKKRHIVLLDVHNQDLLAVYLEINPDAIAHKRYKSSGFKKTNVKHLMSLLCGKLASSEFKRLRVIRADRSMLLSRNASREGVGDLSSKRIALIGCGTIGGYLAELLLRSGAGCGEQYLHLYDRDTFEPQNFARHSLTANEFGLSKAKAIERSLSSSVYMAKNIKGFDMDFSIDERALSKYDIVIDATGRPPVSKKLSRISRSLKDKKRPIIVHAFNDGNGRASKVLVDDGRHCYGCMLVDSQTHRKGLDLRFEHIDQRDERKTSCGSTFTSYDAAVSHVTAALAQEAVLNTLETSLPWTYNEHMFDGSRSRKPRIAKRQPNCPICHEQ
ncbi:ThiF family adenylyltransferase [Enterovibrio norvegicus]|uniref:ThiF family adenylyltransferase n=1 Tax=Enterovibrio norvegicus TaxID=188144 RepID=UPI0013D8DDBF|nr:E2/UBC family protein [Enterovibrio norvegicus]